MSELNCIFFSKRTEPNSFRTESKFFSKTEPKYLKICSEHPYSQAAWYYSTMKNGENWPLTESKPLNQLRLNLQYMIKSWRYASKQNFMKIGSLGASAEMSEI